MLQPLNENGQNTPASSPPARPSHPVHHHLPWRNTSAVSSSSRLTSSWMAVCTRIWPSRLAYPLLTPNEIEFYRPSRPGRVLTTTTHPGRIRPWASRPSRAEVFKIPPSVSACSSVCVCCCDNRQLALAPHRTPPTQQKGALVSCNAMSLCCILILSHVGPRPYALAFDQRPSRNTGCRVILFGAALRHNAALSVPATPQHGLPDPSHPTDSSRYQWSVSRSWLRPDGLA